MISRKCLIHFIKLSDQIFKKKKTVFVQYFGGMLKSIVTCVSEYANFLPLKIF